MTLDIHMLAWNGQKEGNNIFFNTFHSESVPFLWYFISKIIVSYKVNMYSYSGFNTNSVAHNCPTFLILFPFFSKCSTSLYLSGGCKIIWSHFIALLHFFYSSEAAKKRKTKKKKQRRRWMKKSELRNFTSSVESKNTQKWPKWTGLMFRVTA